MSKVRKKLVHIFKKSAETIKYYLTDKNNSILINAWIELENDEPKHRNLGDELNYYLIKELTGKKVFNLCNLYVYNRPNLCCIGSIIDSMANKNSVIWGSGAITNNRIMKERPLKVLAVRGKLTRDYLIKQGIECPPVYGDPALLLPRIYSPKKDKAYKIGIIPHFIDMKDENFKRLIKHHGSDCKVISMCNYRHWHDVIDEINECEFIISSSLHGLIIADAYNIPNKWVEFSDNVLGDGFKFQDYFSSVERTETPLRINKSIVLDDLYDYKNQWKPAKIQLDDLLRVCPFEINDKLFGTSMSANTP